MPPRSRQRNSPIHPMYNDPYNQQPANLMSSQPTQKRNLGNIFSRNKHSDLQNQGIIPRTRAPSTQGKLSLFNPANSTARSGITSIVQPSSISGFLQNTHTFLQNVQQFTPLVQQYGPMVRNIPMMWKLYQGFKNIDTEEPTTTPKEEVKEEITEPVSLKLEHEVSSKVKPVHNGESVPKLFLPH
jgi:hypothetical protein